MTAPYKDDFDLSGFQDVPPSRTSWPPAAKMALVTGVGCSLVVLLEFILISVIVLGIFNARLPDGLHAKLSAPPRAVQGARTALTVVFRNQGKEPFTVQSLTVREATRQDFEFADPEPAPTLPRIELLGTETWTYSRPVAAGQKWTVKLPATPKRAGKLSGTIEVQIDRGVRHLPFSLEVSPSADDSSGRHKRPAQP